MIKIFGLNDRKKLGLDDILNGADEFGLLDIKLPAATRSGDLAAEQFEEVNSFIDAMGCTPSLDGIDFSERQLARRLQSMIEAGDYAGLIALDRHSLFTSKDATLSKTDQDCGADLASENVMSMDDILNSSDLDLFDMGDVSIFDIKHIPESRSTPDDMAHRQECEDFWRFEEIFKKLHADLASKKAQAMRFVENWQIATGDAFILYGVMCFVDDVGQEHERGGRTNSRLNLIFENGTKSNMLRRSLSTALWSDKAGRRILKDRDQSFTESFRGVQLTHRDRRTGVIYIVKTKSQHPALKRFPHLYKIGYTERTVDERIHNAVNDIAFLESPVEKVTEFECFNMNAQRFESMVHGFFGAQRLKITLKGRDGKNYQPREWFAVSLDVARQAIAHIIDGSIVKYRMNNTTGAIVLKTKAERKLD